MFYLVVVNACSWSVVATGSRAAVGLVLLGPSLLQPKPGATATKAGMWHPPAGDSGSSGDIEKTTSLATLGSIAGAKPTEYIDGLATEDTVMRPCALGTI